MLKSILKVIYVAVALIAAVLVYIMGYNSNSINHILNLTSDAIEEKKYVNVGKIHGGCFDVNSIVTENDEDLDIVIFPATTLSSYSYYKDDTKKETIQTNKYDKAYYIYIFNPTFNLMHNEVSGNYVNNAAIRFKSETGSYDYKLEISESVNASLYNSTPFSTEDVILKGLRNSLSYYENWGFINVTLSESIIAAIQNSLNGDISSISVLDRDGESVLDLDVKLDFSQQFFTDVNPLCEKYNTYISEINSTDDAVKENAESKFNAFYEGADGNPGFETTFLENENYSFRYDDKYLQPGSLVWQTIGLEVLYIIIVVLLYILLFHFAFIKRLISRENRGKGYRVNPGANKRNAINAKVEEKKPEVKNQNPTNSEESK